MFKGILEKAIVPITNILILLPSFVSADEVEGVEDALDSPKPIDPFLALFVIIAFWTAAALVWKFISNKKSQKEKKINKTE